MQCSFFLSLGLPSSYAPSSSSTGHRIGSFLPCSIILFFVGYRMLLGTQNQSSRFVDTDEFQLTLSLSFCIPTPYPDTIPALIIQSTLHHIVHLMLLSAIGSQQLNKTTTPTTMLYKKIRSTAPFQDRTALSATKMIPAPPLRSSSTISVEVGLPRSSQFTVRSSSGPIRTCVTLPDGRVSLRTWETDEQKAKDFALLQRSTSLDGAEVDFGQDDTPHPICSAMWFQKRQLVRSRLKAQDLCAAYELKTDRDTKLNMPQTGRLSSHCMNLKQADDVVAAGQAMEVENECLAAIKHSSSNNKNIWKTRSLTIETVVAGMEVYYDDMNTPDGAASVAATVAETPSPSCGAYRGQNGIVYQIPNFC
jgi:hypothetical protein